MPVPVCEKVTA